MHIYFGLALDGTPYPVPTQTTGGVLYNGPQGLLQTLEMYLGLSAPRRNNDYLRIEQYRQALWRMLELKPDVFYAPSFRADQFATAAELLDRRDELILAGADLEHLHEGPDRIAVLAILEQLIQGDEQLGLSPGFADRFQAVLWALEERSVPIDRITRVEPLDVLPMYWQKLLDRLTDQGIRVDVLPPPGVAGDSDLRRLQELLLEEDQDYRKKRVHCDGSLLIVKGKRDTDLSAFFAGLCRKTPDFQPVLLISDQSRTLDNALIQEGLPGLGIPSASLARPTLQLLKLVTIFLWEPIDPFKILEFVSLSVKPLETELGQRIGQQMAQSPGIQGESWRRMLGQYFGEMETLAQEDPGIRLDEVRFQYNFWFERTRYQANGSAPTADALELFDYLHRWALKSYEDQRSTHSSLFILAEQARQVKELLGVLPEQELTRLELERIVRTIYEPAPIELHRREVGAYPVVQQPHAVIGPCRQLLWWNFAQLEPDYFFSRWYQEELHFLEQEQVYLYGPTQQNQQLIWQRQRPILQCRELLVLAVPEISEGNPTQPHPFMGYMEAALDGYEAVTFSIDVPEERQQLEQFFNLPAPAILPAQPLGNPAPFIRSAAAARLGRREKETYTSLEALFYYPYQWVFRYQLKLRQSSILSVVGDNTLLGNLAHRMLEKLLQEPEVLSWARTEVETWIEAESMPLLQREGVVLLMYGREPQRIAFIQRVKYAAWNLLDLIRKNGWSIKATEEALQGKFNGIEIIGRADLVLKRGEEQAILDLKWRGSNRRRNALRNLEDLQLVLYAYLLPPAAQWPHTAYFIINKAEMIARTNAAFKEIAPISPDAEPEPTYQLILERMQATYDWRLRQLQDGQIEVRCARTQRTLEEHYADELLDILEMKTEDARFDDYRVLIQLVE